MDTTETIKIAVKAEVAKAIADLRSLQGTVDNTKKSAGVMTKEFASMRDIMQGPVAAFQAIGAVVQKAGAEFDKMIMAAADSQLALSNLTSVLAASNGVSGMTISSLTALSNELASLTLFEDEAVTQAESVMLTFKNIGKDVFPMATRAAADMATVMGMDLQSATIMLSKALNEPEKGIAALRKAGVQLSEQQTKQVAQFMAVNDVMGAQKIILRELSAEFGGAAESAASTATGAYQNMTKEIGELNEELGRATAISMQKTFNLVAGIAGIISSEMSRTTTNKSIDEYLNYINKSEARLKTGTVKDLKQVASQAGVGLEAILERAKLSYDDAKFQYEQFSSVANKQEANRKEIIVKWIEKTIAADKANADLRAKNAVDQAAADQAKLDAAAKFLETQKLDIAYGKEKIELVKKQLKAEKSEYQAYEDWLTQQAKESADNELQIEQDKAKSILNIRQAAKEKYLQIMDDIAKAAKEKADAEKASDQQKIDNINTVFDLTKNVSDAFMDYEENKSDSVVSGLEKQKAAMEKNGQDTTEIDKKIMAEKNRISEKKFNADKLNAIAQITISTATEAMKVAATPWLAGLVIAAGAVQAGLAGAQTFTPMAGGGFANTPTRALIGEAGAEWVLNRKQMAGLAANGIGGRGGGVTIVQNVNGSIWQSKQLERMALGAVAEAGRGF